MRRRLRTKAPIYAISAVSGEGCRELMYDVQAFLEDAAGQAPATRGHALVRDA